MSFLDRDYVLEPPRVGRISHLDGRPGDAIEGGGRTHAAGPEEVHVVTNGDVGAVMPLRRGMRQASPLADAVGAFTFAKAVGCGIIGASHHTDGATFAPPVTKGQL